MNDQRKNITNPFSDNYDSTPVEVSESKEKDAKKNTNPFKIEDAKLVKPPTYDEAVVDERLTKKYYNKEKKSDDHEDSHHRHHHSHRHHHDKEKKKLEKQKKAHKKIGVDTIDRLDGTGVFGGSFHHDGPYDAVNPHRNKTSNKNAPVLAFPADGPNSSIGGPAKKTDKMDEVFGRDTVESYTDLTSITRQPGANAGTFDSKTTGVMIHGQRTEGLGSTTFLDGAPASQSAIDDDIKNHIRRKQSLKKGKGPRLLEKIISNDDDDGDDYVINTNRRKSIGDLYRTLSSGGRNNKEKEFTGIISDKSPNKERKVKHGNSLLRRVKSLKVSLP